jgi:hypothetical protein
MEFRKTFKPELRSATEKPKLLYRWQTELLQPFGVQFTFKLELMFAIQLQLFSQIFVYR